MTLEVVNLPAAQQATGLPPLLLVHGICHGAWCWSDHYAPYFAAAGHDVYAMSLRGHAGSPGRERLHEPGLSDYADDVLSVATSLPRRPVVVGHSMGGAIAQLAVPRHPELFTGTVLLASMVAGGLRKTELLRMSLNPRGGLALRKLLAGRPLTASATNALPFFGGRLTREQAERYAGLLHEESRRALADLATFAPPAGPFPTPLLVIGSRKDRIFGAAAVRRTAEHYGVEPVLLDVGCHDLMVDPTWRASADAILGWVATL